MEGKWKEVMLPASIRFCNATSLRCTAGGSVIDCTERRLLWLVDEAFFIYIGGNIMRARKWITLALLLAFATAAANVVPVAANPPAPDDEANPQSTDVPYGQRIETQSKTIDQPNIKDYQRLRARQRLLEAGQFAAAAQLNTVQQDRVLVILVEFAGTDTFTWNPATSTWDPMNIADPNEDAGTAGDCSKVTNIPSTPTDFTYGPTLHNQIPRPLSATDPSGTSIWTTDFSKDWFQSFMFGNGVTIDYTRVDGSPVKVDFTGKSVKNFYLDMSGGKYVINGDVIGWLQVPHSEMWYGADQCPGARSTQGGYSPSNSGGINDQPAGNARSLVKDVLDLVEAERQAGQLGDFNWADYDLNGDHIIDRLWIVHSGYGEEDNTTLLNRTDYGEGSLWSHSSAVTPDYPIGETGYFGGPYIMMPENGGIGVFAHEYGHNLGAADLYAYGYGETSAGFWTTMADDWTGFPIGFQPPSMDPLHLDLWGWLNPKIITDPTKEYIVTIGQTSEFPGGPGVYRGVKIELPDGQAPLPVEPYAGSYMWWGGKADLMNAKMTLNTPLHIPNTATNAELQFQMAYDIETEWDFLWVQASTDNGSTWDTLTNEDTICTHDPSWIGGYYGFPDDLCGAGLGGFSGTNPSFPGYDLETFDLSGYAGKDILLRFWYMTDWGTTYAGPFLDDVKVVVDGSPLFYDGAEAGDSNWTYEPNWQRSNGLQTFTHNFYLQWRNVSSTGGYDSALGDSRWRYGPANSGLVVWYNNNFYSDNEIFNYLTDWPAFGPKGMMLVVDSHPDPYRDPALVASGYNNEGGNLTSRMMMRDAPFSLNDTVDFTYNGVTYEGRPAVSAFHDSYTYYPGAEYVSRGPGYPSSTAYKWVTKQWDASVVLPAKDFYGIKAPGYTGDQQFRFFCSPYPGGLLSCYYFPSGLGFDGSSGNPGDVMAQYGWHVQILSQTDKTATLKIWNAIYDLADQFTPNKTTSKINDVITYTYTLSENIGSPVDLFTCIPLDSTKEEFIQGSQTGGAIPLIMSCPEAQAALQAGKPLRNLAPENTIGDPSAYKAIAWYSGPIATGASSTGFSYQVKVKTVAGILQANMDFYNVGEFLRSLLADPVTILADFVLRLPIIFR
jgi:immune inhibitor A